MNPNIQMVVYIISDKLQKRDDSCFKLELVCSVFFGVDLLWITFYDAIESSVSAVNKLRIGGPKKTITFRGPCCFNYKLILWIKKQFGKASSKV
jgi:hypothetical protein